MLGLTQVAEDGYVLEGPTFQLFDGPGGDAYPLIPMYQRYCTPCTDHMPTLDANEGSPSYGGANILGWCSPTPTAWAPTQLTRLYSAKASDHFVTANDAEVAAAASLGYANEWSCWGPATSGN